MEKFVESKRNRSVRGLDPLDLAVAPVARLLHFQNIPLITMGAVSNEFTLQRETMYSTLFRFGYRTDELGRIPWGIEVQVDLEDRWLAGTETVLIYDRLFN